MTLFKGINKLEPGYRMVIQVDGSTHKEQYWDPLPDGSQPSIDFDGQPIEQSKLIEREYWNDEKQCIQTIRTLLKQSIKDRMMSDVPFGVFLSGGIDSSTNVALMAELMDRPVDTFSVGFRDLEKYNELQYSRQIAKEFKTNHHEIIIDQKDAFDFLPKLIFHQDEPIADPVCIPLYFVSKLARDNGTIVVQVGEGSDEQFAGYQWMLRELRFYKTLWKAFTTLPKGVQRLLYNTAEGIFSPRYSYLALDYIRKAVENNELFWGGAIAFTERHKRSLLQQRLHFGESNTHRYVQHWHQHVLERDPYADYLKRMIYIEFAHRLPELLLMRVDKMSMATSVEARVPFLDHRMVEYSMHIPQKFKIRHGQTKYILKNAVEGIIPNNIIYRRKQGFAAPVDEWLRTDWSLFAKEKITNSFFTREQIFDRTFLQNLFHQHVSGKRNEGQYIWTLLNLILWHESWIEGKSM
jgi:asparagine synthase (glutamine-hydrolysing)